MAKEITGFKKTEAGLIPKDWYVLNLGLSSTLKARIGWQGLTTKEYLNTGDFYLVTGTDFENGFIDWDHCVFVEKERYDQDKNIQLKKGDVLVTKDGTIGKVAYINKVPKPTTLNSGVFVIRPKSHAYDSNYFYYVLRSVVFQDFLSKLSAGSTINHLYQKDFIFFNFSAPPTLTEQQAIATALSDTDGLIAGLEKLIAKKKAIKQGAMQQLLTPPSKGGKRLPGFSGEWLQKPIGELFIIYAGGDLDWSNFSKKKEGDYRFPVFANSLKNKGVYGYTKLPKYPKDSITVTARGSLGYAEYRSCEFDAIVRLLVLVPKELISGIFFKEYINNYIEFAHESTGVPQLTAPQISNYEIVYPNDTDEQTAISSILNDMDKELEVLESKKKKYEQLKQGMMQELLTGKTRLV